MALTPNEHEELSNELKRSAVRLQQLCELVVNEYGPQSLAGFSFLKTMENLDRLLHEMEAQAERDRQGYPIQKLSF
jgi:hypothetical protein